MAVHTVYSGSNTIDPVGVWAIGIIESATVIFNAYLHCFLAAVEKEIEAGGFCMPVNIGNRFLNNAIAETGNAIRKLIKITCSFNILVDLIVDGLPVIQ